MSLYRQEKEEEPWKITKRTWLERHGRGGREKRGRGRGWRGRGLQRGGSRGTGKPADE